MRTRQLPTLNVGRTFTAIAQIRLVSKAATAPSLLRSEGTTVRRALPTQKVTTLASISTILTALKLWIQTGVTRRRGLILIRPTRVASVGSARCWSIISTALTRAAASSIARLSAARVSGRGRSEAIPVQCCEMRRVKVPLRTGEAQAMHSASAARRAPQRGAGTDELAPPTGRVLLLYFLCLHQVAMSMYMKTVL